MHLDTSMDNYDTSMVYIGCIGVNKSMKTLSHVARSEVAKESIKRLCEANNINRNFDKKRSECIDLMLDNEPNLTNSGTEVHLSVTSSHFNVISKATEQIIVQHEIPNVSFASSGDPDTVDFVAYVATDQVYGRACFVLKCGFETAQDLLETIARGFHLRTQQILFTNSNQKIKTTGSNEEVIALTRSSLEKEPWFHGSYLSREESEARLKKDGDFLVRESLLEPGHFVLSVMNNGLKLHLLFDSMGQVRTKDTVFNDVSHLVKFHHDEGSPIVADNRFLFLRNGVRPTPRS